ncbi:MAG: prepilin peptidase, partial [Candidatus Hydrogenedentes bacterium]|nr:prepilin peptidase [Candidatus Hydrogenedentota bacterium]
MTFPEMLQPLHGFFMISAFVFGMCVGSFCNVCACRWPAGESVVAPRSRCPKCLNGIAWYDNIPLISWLILGAKCRHCKTPISVQYPLIEALTGMLFLGVYWRFGVVIATPVYMVFCAAMVIITFQDLADWTIPNEVTFPGIPAGIVLALLGMAWGVDSGLRVTDV